MKNQIKAALIASFYVLISSRITPAADVINAKSELLNSRVDSKPSSSQTTTQTNDSGSGLSSNSNSGEASNSQNSVPTNQKVSPKQRRKQCLNENPKMSMEELKACAIGKSK